MNANNKKRFLKRALAAGVLALCAHNALAAPVVPTLDLWGTEAFSAYCNPNACGGVSGFGVSSTTEHFQEFSADNALASGTNAVESHALLTKTSGLRLPELTAKATGPLLAEGIASAIGAYSYNGANVVKTLNASLSGTILNPGKSPLTNIKVGVAIFDALTLETALTDFHELAGAATSLAFGKTVKLSHGTPKALKTLLLSLTSTGSKSGSIDLPLVNGQSFYLVTSLLAEAGKGGTADALHTFTLAFNDNKGLVSHNVVPVPGAAWMLGSALVAALSLKRRRA